MAEEAEGRAAEGRLEGRYTNTFRVGFNGFEFVLEFGQEYDHPDGAAHTRIITTPFGAKALSRLLSSSVRQYEAKFGEIHGDIPEPAGSES